MGMTWAIEDGLSIPWASLIGESSATPSSLSFSTNSSNTHEVMLTLHYDDGSSRVLTFNRNGVPLGPAVEVPAPPPPPGAAAAEAAPAARSGRR